MINPFHFGSSTKRSAIEVQNEPIRKVLASCKRALRLTLVLTVLIELLTITPILYMLNMYDRVMNSRSEVTLVSLTVLVLGVYLFWALLEWIRTRLMLRISLRVDWDLASNVFDAAFRRLVGKRQVNANEVFSDLTQVRQFLTGSSLIALMKAPFAVIFIILGAMFHPYLAIFALIAMVILLLTAVSNQRMTTPVLKAANDMQTESIRMAGEALKQSDTALALGMQPHLRERWHEKHLNSLQMQLQASEVGGIMSSLSSFLTNSMPSLQIALGVYLAIQGLITGGMVIAASLIIGKSIQPIQQVLGSWKQIVSAGQSYERLNTLLLEDQKDEERMPLPPPLGKIAVANATVMPEGTTKPILQNLNFAAEPGTIIAVVGPSAAGKTSLARLLTGIWKPSRGNVRLDGAEISDWAHDDLGIHMGYVPQEIEFCEGTVAENIARLGTVSPDQVIEAAKATGIHDLILALPQGYDTKIGATGHVLTGGQKQRVALARAVYGNPKYIVMDEPNANLDDASERVLKELIANLRKDQVTVIFTTHRPSLVNCADYLLVLNDGRQVAYGRVDAIIGAAQKFQAEKQAPKPAISAAG
jgi:PrtD family type I secretion system ABC transporter